MVFKDDSRTRDRAVKPGIITAAGVLVIALAILLPRALALNRFATPDEHLWLYRSGNFYYALGQRDFASTYQREHPGVTTMWAGMGGFLTRFPGYRGSGMGQVDSPKLDYYLRNIANIPPLEILVASRYFIVLGNVCVLLVGFLYSRRLIGTTAAIVGFMFIAFDPFHTALTRILHLDGSLSSLLLLSLLAFIHFLYQRNIFDMIVSGAAAGLSWLTKSPGLFIIPAVGLITLIDFARSFSTHTEIQMTRRVWSHLWPLLAWGSIAVFIFVLLWPAMWVAPLQTLNSVLSQAQQYAKSGHHSPIFFNGDISQSGDLGVRYIYFYPLTYIWRSTPVVLIGLLVTIGGYIKKRDPLNRRETHLTVCGLLIFVLTYTILMTIGTKKFDRYLLPVYAPLDIIAAVGWVSLANWLGEKVHRPALKYSPYLILVILTGLQMFWSIKTYPYFLSYYNPLLGGSAKAPEVMQIGWGEGLDQAARYLNNKPNAEHLRVGAWYSPGSFSYFFSGHTHTLTSNPKLKDGQWQRFVNADYIVIYIHQWQRYVPKQVLDYLSEKKPEHTISINGIEYVEIYKMH